MSESPRADIVRAYIERSSTFDIDGDEGLVTDDFLYRVRPKPPSALGLGNTDGVFDKAGLREYYAVLAPKMTYSSVSLRLSPLHSKPYLTVANL